MTLTKKYWERVREITKDNNNYLVNLSNQVLDKNTIALLGKGLSFIPKSCLRNEELLVRQVNEFCRKLRLRYLFRGFDSQLPKL